MIPVISVVMVPAQATELPCLQIAYCVLQVLLTLFTLWKVFGRWKRANSVISILPNGAADSNSSGAGSGGADSASADNDASALRPGSIAISTDSQGNRMFVPANAV